MQEDQQEGFYQGNADNISSSSESTNREGVQSDSVSPGETLVSWTASEYISHHKPPAWYAAILMVAAVIAGALFLFTNDLISTIAVVIAGVLFAIFAGREPEVRTYELTTTGLMISNKLYPYSLFKSYAIHEQDAIRSIYLLPIKRFMPGITLYFPPENEENITEILGSYLPLEDRGPDAIDRLMHKIRF